MDTLGNVIAHPFHLVPDYLPSRRSTHSGSNEPLPLSASGKISPENERRRGMVWVGSMRSGRGTRGVAAVGFCCRTEYNSWLRRRKWSTCNRPVSVPPSGKYAGLRKPGVDNKWPAGFRGLSSCSGLLTLSCLLFFGGGMDGIDRLINFVRRLRDCRL